MLFGMDMDHTMAIVDIELKAVGVATEENMTCRYLVIGVRYDHHYLYSAITS